MSHGNQFSLLKERRFLPFFLTQSLNAFNDNVFKQALIALITFGALALNEEQRKIFTQVAAGLFILPFFLFSATFSLALNNDSKTLHPAPSFSSRSLTRLVHTSSASKYSRNWFISLSKISPSNRCNVSSSVGGIGELDVLGFPWDRLRELVKIRLEHGDRELCKFVCSVERPRFHDAVDRVVVETTAGKCTFKGVNIHSVSSSSGDSHGRRGDT